MPVITFILAVLALVVSLSSLSWQIFSFSLSGRKVQVYVFVGWRGNGSQLILKSVKKNDDPLDVLSRLSGYGPSTPVLGVTVHNVGRSDLYVSAVFIAGKSDSNTFFPTSSATWPALPHLLKSGDSESWYMDTAQLKAVCDSWNLAGDKGELEMRVGLKDGRTIRVSRKVKVNELRKIWNVSNLDHSANGAAAAMTAEPPAVGEPSV